MTQSTIKKIELALGYYGDGSGRYLRIMDGLAFHYSGAPAIKVSKLIEDFRKVKNIKDWDELKVIYGL